MAMRTITKRSAGWTAIFAIAFHGLLYGLTPLAAAPADPFSVICHSGAQNDADQSLPGSTPSNACEHCNLCSATTPPLAPAVVLGRIVAPDLLQVFTPVSDTRASGSATAKQLARGPPSFV